MGLQSYLLGRAGEADAIPYLIEHGYRVLEQNFHSRHGEIDIVAEKDDFLVFVEVKHYSASSWGSPFGAIRKSKRESLIYAARYFLYVRGLTNRFCRFDILSIIRKPDKGTTCEILENAFFVNKR